MKVVATAPRPGRKTASLPSAGLNRSGAFIWACGYQLRERRAIARAGQARGVGVAQKAQRFAAAPGGRRNISRGFWHTEVRNGRHTRAYTCFAAAVTTLSQ